MRIPKDLAGARLNITATAEQVQMHVGHFRRLVRRGVLPQPKRTTKRMPYYDFELLQRIGEILKSGVGGNGEEIAFYRRKPKSAGTRRSTRRRRVASAIPDAFLEALADGLRQLGINEQQLDERTLKAAVIAEFGNERPELAVSVPVIARRLLDGQG